jgi:hypothetical protein
MPKRGFRCLFAIVAILSAGLVGCGRAKVQTEIRTDGTWTRRVEFHLPGLGGPGGAGGPGGMPFAGKAEETFLLPRGPEWTVTKASEEGEIVYTATRTLKVGDVLRQDVALRKQESPFGMGMDGGVPPSPPPKAQTSPKPGKGKGKASTTQQKPAVKPAPQPAASAKPLELLVVNEVTVRQLSPGRYEYRETVRWVGKKPKEMGAVDADMLKQIKSALPSALATDANVADVGRVMTKELWRMLFGPGDPLFSQIIMHPDLAERRFRREAGRAIDTSLQQKFGDSLSVEDRHQAARKLVSVMFEKSPAKSIKSKAGDPLAMGGGADGPGDFSLVAMTFSVKLPGKIVSTNGEVDEVNGEVYWAMYAMAPVVGDVEMTAVCETQ